MARAADIRKVPPHRETPGKLPPFPGVQELRSLGHPESPIRAIRAKCVDCSGGSLSEVRKCPAVRCPLWPMRMGKNPFFGKRSPRSGSGTAGAGENSGTRFRSGGPPVLRPQEFG
jgi:hypothetical protein